MRTAFLTLGLMALVACGDKDDDSGTDGTDGADGTSSAATCTDGTACCDYVNAILGCYERVGYDTTGAGVDPTTCEGYDPSADPYFECLADAWNASTCNAIEDITATAQSAATECVVR